LSVRIELKLTNGVLNLEELKVSEKEKGAELISLPQFSVEGANIDFSQAEAHTTVIMKVSKYHPFGNRHLNGIPLLQRSLT
jgi:hypothetical protein